MEKYYDEQGRVAVLISSGYGAGWSTWGGGDFALFDKTLVQMCLDGKSEEEVSEYLESVGQDFYTGGWGNIGVEWLETGTQFRVDEYDGSESLEILSEMNFTVA